MKKVTTDTYSIVITWDDLEYKYDSDLEWDFGNRRYKPVDEVQDNWVLAEGTSKGKINIVNNSASSVYATIKFTNKASESGIGAAGEVQGKLYKTIEYNDDDIYKLFAKAINPTAINAGKIIFSLSGKPTFSNNCTKNDLTEGIVLGSFTITLISCQTYYLCNYNNKFVYIKVQYAFIL